MFIIILNGNLPLFLVFLNRSQHDQNSILHPLYGRFPPCCIGKYIAMPDGSVKQNEKKMCVQVLYTDDTDL